MLGIFGEVGEIYYICGELKYLNLLINGKCYDFRVRQVRQIRTAGTSEESLFCLADVCKALDLEVQNTKKRLKDPWVYSIQVGVQTGVKSDGSPAIQQVDMTFINEQNLYRVIMRSDKPQAEAFQDWVCGEVLPSIRKNGAYMTEKTLERALAEPDFLIQLAQQLKEEKTKRLELEKDNKILKPKADYFDDLVDRNLLTNFRDFAKELNVRQKYLIEWLISNRYIYRNEKGKIKSYSKYSEGDSRLFEVKEYKATNNSHSGTQTLITPRGRETFRLLIPRQQDLDI